MRVQRVELTNGPVVVLEQPVASGGGGAAVAVTVEVERASSRCGTAAKVEEPVREVPQASSCCS